MNNFGIQIAGTGSYLPERVLSNRDLEDFLDTSDTWIQNRTGIRERHLAADDEPTSHLAAHAAVRALDMAGMHPSEVQLIIVATITPDRPFPNTACFVQKEIEAWNAACFSVEGACSGFVYALDIGAAMLRSSGVANALIIGAEKMSSLLDWQDRSTCVLFGDGAGAAVIKRCAPEQNCYLGATLGSNGRSADLLHVPAGGSELPITPEILQQRLQYLKMSGPEIFKQAVTSMVHAARTALDMTGLSADEIRWLIPHQANIRIIKNVTQRLGLAPEQVYVNVQRTGNSSAATIPLALDEVVRAGRVAPGDRILLVAFGGGLTWGASVLRWPAGVDVPADTGETNGQSDEKERGET